MPQAKSLEELAADAVAADLADAARKTRETRARKVLEQQVDELKRRLDNLALQHVGYEAEQRAMKRAIGQTDARVTRLDERLRAEIEAWGEQLRADLTASLRDITEP